MVTWATEAEPSASHHSRAEASNPTDASTCKG